MIRFRSPWRPSSPTYNTGVRFTLGVPAALNHGNQATAPAPLNFSGMFWTWQDGYKFLRTEGKTVGGRGTFMMHLGSTGCLPGATGQTDCTNLNMPDIRLTGFDPASQPIGIDLAALLSGSKPPGSARTSLSSCAA